MSAIERTREILQARPYGTKEENTVQMRVLQPSYAVSYRDGRRVPNILTPLINQAVLMFNNLESTPMVPESELSDVVRPGLPNFAKEHRYMTISRSLAVHLAELDKACRSFCHVSLEGFCPPNFCLIGLLTLPTSTP